MVDPATETSGTVSIKAKKTNINVRLASLAWTSHWRAAQGGVTAAWE